MIRNERKKRCKYPITFTYSYNILILARTRVTIWCTNTHIRRRFDWFCGPYNSMKDHFHSSSAFQLAPPLFPPLSLACYLYHILFTQQAGIAVSRSKTKLANQIVPYAIVYAASVRQAFLIRAIILILSMVLCHLEFIPPNEHTNRMNIAPFSRTAISRQENKFLWYSALPSNPFRVFNMDSNMLSENRTHTHIRNLCISLLAMKENLLFS